MSAMAPPRYWLMKSEPDVYSISDLESNPREIWDGIRNYQARNFLKSMEVGDIAFFYHSNTKPPGIVGLMTIAETMVVDPSQFEVGNKYVDPKSDRDNPRWHTVTVAYKETFQQMITLDQLKASFTPEELLVVQRGTRLSVLPVELETAQRLLAMAAA
jgi:predicted RNA-binding protein with PUA-like domain